MWKTLKTGYDDASAVAARMDVIDVVSIVTAIVMIRNSHGGVYLMVSIAAIAIMLGFAKVRRSPWFWLGLAAVWAPRLIFHCYENEDHIFFGVYWFAAIGLALWGDQQHETLAKSARLLIGLSFAFALLWKLMVPQFHDSSLLHYKLLYDYRFREMVTEPIGGLSQSATETNIDSIRSLRESPIQPTAVPIEVPARVTVLARSATAWTILAEGMLAALFLLPATKFTTSWRDPTLIFFMISTYIVAPVLGFASIFTAMGIAQDQSKNGRTRLAYGLTLLILLAWVPLRGCIFPPVF